jgi:hypothetical protein
MSLLVLSFILVPFMANAADNTGPPKGYVSLEQYQALQSKYQQTEADLTEALTVCDQYKALVVRKDEQIADLLKSGEDLAEVCRMKDDIVKNQQAIIARISNQFGVMGGLDLDGGYALGVMRKWTYSGLSVTHAPKDSKTSVYYTLFF